MSETIEIQGWSVTVSVNTEDVLTISDKHLAGSASIEDFAPVVRTAAAHLLAFIGAGPDIVGNHIGAAPVERGGE